MQRRKFGREFKIKAVRLVRERGVSVAQAARDLDVTVSPLTRDDDHRREAEEAVQRFTEAVEDLIRTTAPSLAFAPPNAISPTVCHQTNA